MTGIYEQSALTRKADREAFARTLVDLAQREGATASMAPAPLDRRPGEYRVRIAAGGAAVGLSIDHNARAPGWMTPWCVDGESDAKFSPAFGIAVRAEVNPYHRRKCMGYARDAGELVADITRALRCIAAGKAFLKD